MVAAVVARGRPVGTIRQTYFASAEDRCAAGEAAPAPGELELAALPLGGFGLAWLASATSWELLSWTANARSLEPWPLRPPRSWPPCGPSVASGSQGRGSSLMSAGWQVAW